MDFVASEVCGGVKMKQRSSCLTELKEARADSKPVEVILVNLSLNDTSA